MKRLTAEAGISKGVDSDRYAPKLVGSGGILRGQWCLDDSVEDDSTESGR